MTIQDLRCIGDHPTQPGKRCNLLLAHIVTAPFEFGCKRCKRVVTDEEFRGLDNDGELGTIDAITH